MKHYGDAQEMVPPELTTERTAHTPVMMDEVLALLAPRPGLFYADLTLGAGGHAREILRRILPGGFLLAMDQDPAALALGAEALREFPETAYTARPGNFSSLGMALASLPGRQKIDGGVLVDLGVSSMQLDTADRGFSFSRNAALDMRMDPSGAVTAAALVNEAPEAELCRIFSEYGEERFSRTVAREIVRVRENRPIETTGELAALVAGIHERYTRRGGGGKSGRKVEKGGTGKTVHPATQVFQALRIAVNDELGHLETLLESLPDLLAPGARFVAISFHSLEDRIVKRFFQRESQDCVCPPRFPVCRCDHRARMKILTGKPVLPTEAEIRRNPRSRSAKIRACERI